MTNNIPLKTAEHGSRSQSAEKEGFRPVYELVFGDFEMAGEAFSRFPELPDKTGDEKDAGSGRFDGVQIFSDAPILLSRFDDFRNGIKQVFVEFHPGRMLRCFLSFDRANLIHQLKCEGILPVELIGGSFCPGNSRESVSEFKGPDSQLMLLYLSAFLI